MAAYRPHLKSACTGTAGYAGLPRILFRPCADSPTRAAAAAVEEAGTSRPAGRREWARPIPEPAGGTGDAEMMGAFRLFPGARVRTAGVARIS